MAKGCFLKKKIRQIGKFIFNIFLPNVCVLCRCPCDDGGAFCSSCWNEIEFLKEPLCNICGTKLDFLDDDFKTCIHCLEQSPSYKKHRSLMIYNQKTSPIILRLKHSDEQHIAAKMIPLLEACGKDLINACDFIAMVPIHWIKLFFRQYNQSALLAQKIATNAKKPFVANLLSKKKYTSSQQGKTYKQRYKNVKNSFIVNQNMDIREKNILLVDDVYTTGATVNACANELIQAGAKNVFVLTLAKVVRRQREK